jgi:antitoxin component HigA of HigAB toxin-antitoxin module
MTLKELLRNVELGNREALAYHEAGHAFVMLELHCPFKHVTIVPEDGAAGRVEPEPVEVVKGYVNMNQVLSFMAGPKAEEIACGTADHLRSQQDYQWALQYVTNSEDVSEYQDSTPFAMDLIVACSDEAERILIYSWPCVEAIAHALVSTSNLTEDQVRDISESPALADAMERQRELYVDHTDEDGRLIEE